MRTNGRATNEPADSAAESLISRLTSLRQYNASGKRAPHKPLLVLLALGQLASTGSSRLEFNQVAGELGRLIAEYGPSSRTAPRQAAAYPFTYLRTDGVWLLDRDVPMGQPAALAGVAGRLSSELEATLSRDPLLLAAVARGVVDAQFPAMLADEVLVSCGLDPEVMRSSGAVSDIAARRTRSAAWRASVVSDWDGACAFCGYDGSLSGVPVGIEAAHVRWFNFDGPDDPDNGLALCSLHHELLDRGVLGLTRDHEIVVSRAFRATSAVGRAVYDLEGSTLTPRPGTVLPALMHIEWHWRQVFRAPGLRVG